MAIDGSFLRLLSDKELLEYFGSMGNDSMQIVMALASMLYDLENNIIVDAKITSIHDNERSLAEEHLSALQSLADYNLGHRELIIFDRGYPSFDLIKSLSDKEIAYVMRVWKGFVNEQELGESEEGWVSLGKTGRQVRLIRLELSSGEQELLVTNLTEKQMEYAAFGELYHKRWGIETGLYPKKYTRLSSLN